MYHKLIDNLDYYVTDDYYEKLKEKDGYVEVNTLDYLSKRPAFYFIYLKDKLPSKVIISIDFKKQINSASANPPTNVTIFYEDDGRTKPTNILIDSKYSIQIDNNEVYFAQAKEGE